MWDLTTALEFYNKGAPTTQSEGGPTPEEMIRLLDHCDLSNSRTSTPCCISPSPSMITQQQQHPGGGGGPGSSSRVKAANLAFLNSQHHDSHT